MEVLGKECSGLLTGDKKVTGSDGGSRQIPMGLGEVRRCRMSCNRSWDIKRKKEILWQLRIKEGA